MKTKILTIILLFAIFGCREEEKEFTIETYPTKVGNEWVYKTQYLLKKYESETSNIFVEFDTIESVEIVRVERDMVLNDTMNVKEITTSNTALGRSDVEYCYTDEEGYKMYAYELREGGKSSKDKKAALLNAINDTFNQRITENKSQIIVFPRLIYKLPLTTNMRWKYSENPSLFWSIDKESVGVENLTIMNSVQTCIKVRWDYVGTDVFDEIEYTDWVSSIGLVKAVAHTERVELRTIEGDIHGWYQITSTTTLEQVTIR